MNLTDARATHVMNAHRPKSRLIARHVIQQFYRDSGANLLGDQFDRHL